LNPDSTPDSTFSCKLGQKNKLGLSLRTKNGLFWAKILIEIESKGQKLIKKKKKKKKKKNDISGQKKKVGLSFRTKKVFFGQKL